MGLPLVAVPEAAGGADGTLADLLALLRLSGSHAVPVPLMETALANLVLAAAGGVPVEGPAALIAGGLTLAGGKVSGTAKRVAFAGVAAQFVAVIGVGPAARVVVLDRSSAKVAVEPSFAGEPYGSAQFEGAAPVQNLASPVSEVRLRELAALARAMQMAGAADRALAITVEYCKQRSQFGRPISNFQAIQHLLAELASCVAATVAAAEAASRDASEVGIGSGAEFSIAAAKTQASEFAQRIAAMAHQSMGAMGFTQEHVLHHYTRRLWVWRRDWGSETEWGAELGAAVARAGAETLWPTLTSSRFAA